jgi:hypothetical protein
MERDKQKTLIVKNGRWIWPDEELESDLNIRFPPRWRVAVSENETDFWEDFLKSRLASKSCKPTSFVTYDDFSKMEHRMLKIEEEIGRIVPQPPMKEIDQIVEDVASELRPIEEAKKAYYSQDKNVLHFSVMVSGLSTSLLERISKMEISISRKYPTFSIEIEPATCDEDVLKGSRLILVKE